MSKKYEVRVDVPVLTWLRQDVVVEAENAEEAQKEAREAVWEVIDDGDWEAEWANCSWKASYANEHIRDDYDLWVGEAEEVEEDE
jgi:hypothetical protein